MWNSIKSNKKKFAHTVCCSSSRRPATSGTIQLTFRLSRYIARCIHKWKQERIGIFSTDAWQSLRFICPIGVEFIFFYNISTLMRLVYFPEEYNQTHATKRGCKHYPIFNCYNSSIGPILDRNWKMYFPG